MLITPGHRADRISKAATLAADCIVMDIEDGVGQPEKPAARRTITQALASLDFGHRERLVRLGWVGAATWVSLETAADEAPVLKGLEQESERRVGKARLTLLRAKALTA